MRTHLSASFACSGALSPLPSILWSYESPPMIDMAFQTAPPVRPSPTTNLKALSVKIAWPGGISEALMTRDHVGKAGVSANGQRVRADGWAAPGGFRALLQLYGERRIGGLADTMPSRPGDAAGTGGRRFDSRHREGPTRYTRAGAGCVARLIAQAFWAVRRTEWHLRRALCPNVELVTWALKRPRGSGPTKFTLIKFG